MNIKRILLIIVVLIVAIGLCFLVKKNTTTTTNTETTEEIKIMLTAEEIIDKLQEKISTIDNIIVYTEETDTNSLLGRPNQYTSKVSFADTRIEQYSEEDPFGGTIEVFENNEDMENRKTYIETISSSSSMFAQYIYSNDYVLLRIDKELTPSQAQEYETAFNEIMDNQ